MSLNRTASLIVLLLACTSWLLAGDGEYGPNSSAPQTSPLAPAAAPLNTSPLAEEWLVNWAAKEYGAPQNDICNTQNSVFLPGEKVTYILYYNWNFVWLPAGEVDFRIHDLPNQYHITVVGKTYESYEWLYSSTQRFESYLDKETLLPEMHIKDVVEGSSGYSRYDRTVFNQAKQTAVSHRGKTRDDLTAEQLDLEQCMHDVVSIVYYARNLKYSEMTVGEKIPMKILMDRETHDVDLRYLGAEAKTKVRGFGKFRTQRFSPQLIAGDVFNEGDEMQIWVTNDRNKLPVLIESPVSVGSVKAVLKSYSGLKYPLSALIERE